jgi:hypothetical protein
LLGQRGKGARERRTGAQSQHTHPFTRLKLSKDKSTAGEDGIIEVGRKVKVKAVFHRRYLWLYLTFKQNSIK